MSVFYVPSHLIVRENVVQNLQTVSQITIWKVQPDNLLLILIFFTLGENHNNVTGRNELHRKHRDLRTATRRERKTDLL